MRPKHLNTKPKIENHKKLHHNKPHTTRTTTTPERGRQPEQSCGLMLATTIHKSNTTPHHQDGATTRTPTHPPPKKVTIQGRHPPHKAGPGPVVSGPNSVSGDTRSTHPKGAGPALVNVLFHRAPEPDPLQTRPIQRIRSKTGNPAPAGRPEHRGPLERRVIQPHLPVRLPCYDFVPIADPTFDGSSTRVRPPASGVTDFHDVTGGVYKARERIHRSVADLRLLATPTSRGRVVQTPIRTETGFNKDSLHLTASQPFVPAIVACVKPWTYGMMT